MQIISKYEDLTEYSHLIAPYKFEGIKNVGWLDLKAAFVKGEVPAGFFEKLCALAVNSAIFQPIVEPSRMRPVCEMCGEIVLRNAEGNIVRDSELWIPSGETIYASPIAILHYIREHKYRPPSEYVEAVLEADTSIPFDGDKMYRERLVTSGWFLRPR